MTFDPKRMITAREVERALRDAGHSEADAEPFELATAVSVEAADGWPAQPTIERMQALSKQTLVDQVGEVWCTPPLPADPEHVIAAGAEPGWSALVLIRLNRHTGRVDLRLADPPPVGFTGPSTVSGISVPWHAQAQTTQLWRDATRLGRAWLTGKPLDVATGAACWARLVATTSESVAACLAAELDGAPVFDGARVALDQFDRAAIPRCARRGTGSASAGWLQTYPPGLPLGSAAALADAATRGDKDSTSSAAIAWLQKRANEPSLRIHGMGPLGRFDERWFPRSGGTVSSHLDGLLVDPDTTLDHLVSGGPTASALSTDPVEIPVASVPAHADEPLHQRWEALAARSRYGADWRTLAFVLGCVIRDHPGTGLVDASGLLGLVGGWTIVDGPAGRLVIVGTTTGSYRVEVAGDGALLSIEGLADPGSVLRSVLSAPAKD
jgi:hypothetical protein